MHVLVRATAPVSLRNACDISRACKPTWLSPILTFELGFRQRAPRHRIDHDYVNRATLHERGCNFQRLAQAGIRLRHEQIVYVHAEFPRIDRIERMFRIDERRRATQLLRLLNRFLQSHRRLPGRLRTKIAITRGRVETRRLSAPHRATGIPSKSLTQELHCSPRGAAPRPCQTAPSAAVRGQVNCFLLFGVSHLRLRVPGDKVPKQKNLLRETGLLFVLPQRRQHAQIFQRRHIAFDFRARRQLAQQPPHNLPAARLRQ